MPNILNLNQLKALSQHKYSVESSSLIEPFLQPYWNWIVLKLPFWLAPNLITITGLVVNIVTALILMFYDGDAGATGSEGAPRWAYLLCGLGLFIYQTLDAIDGKQARRTGSASPLGELFDHGCDSISTIFVAVSTCVSVQFGSRPTLMLAEIFCVYALFYLAHWRAYLSGTLHFGKIDVTEAQYGVITVHLVSFFLGPAFWTRKLFGKVEPWVFILVLTVLTGFLVIKDFFSAIQRGGIGKNGSTVAGTSILSPAVPFLLVIVPSCVIAVKSKSGIYTLNPTLYMVMFGILFAKITNKLVVAHLSKSKMDMLDSGMFGVVILFLNQYFNEFIPEYYALWLALIWCTVDLMLYCRSVCLEMCSYMKIELFTIPDISNDKHR